LEDVILAYNQNKLEIHSLIWIRIKNPNLPFSNLTKVITLNDETTIEYYENQQVRKERDGKIIVHYIQTTTGRAILNYTIERTLNFL